MEGDASRLTSVKRMIRVMQAKRFSSIAVFVAIAAAATDIRPVLPPVEYPDTEVVTNVAVSAQGSREYAFELSFSGTASNNVEIAFGADADGDGALSVGEIGFSAGWNMVRLVGRGENVRSGEQFHVTATSHGLTLRLK